MDKETQASTHVRVHVKCIQSLWVGCSVPATLGQYVKYIILNKNLCWMIVERQFNGASVSMG